MRMRLPLLLMTAALLPGCSPATSSAPGAVGIPPGTRALALEEVGNSDRLAARLAAHILSSEPADTSLLFIAYDDTGALTSARVYRRGTSAETSREMEALLRDELAPVATPRSLGWYLFEAGDAPRLLPTAPPVPRPPRLINRTQLAQTLQGLANRPTMPDASVRVRIFIDSDGTVGTAEIVASSGRIEVDRQLLNVARMARFTTAHLDDFVVCAWVEMPVTIRRDRWEFMSERLAQPPGHNSSAILAGPGF